MRATATRTVRIGEEAVGEGEENYCSKKPCGAVDTVDTALQTEPVSGQIDV